jgi:hypothetical protein
MGAGENTLLEAEEEGLFFLERKNQTTSVY